MQSDVSHARPRGFSASRSGWWLLLGLLAWRLAMVPLARLDSDEPQHLHVVWAWTQSLVPYRDVFDNHVPLFHMAYAPVLALLGERADVLLWMRLAIVPLAVASLLLAWRVGVRHWGRAATLAGLALLVIEPAYTSMLGQFRADALWAFAAIASVAAAALMSSGPKRGFVTGLLAGVALCSSLKTLPLFAAALATAVLLWVFLPASRRGSASCFGKEIAAGLVGLLLVIAGVMLVVFAKGALQAMPQAVFGHNVLDGFGRNARQFDVWKRCLGVALVLVTGGVLAHRHLRNSTDPAAAAWRWFLAGYPLVFALLLYAAWPLLTSQDYMPILPPFAPAVGAGIVFLLKRLRIPFAVAVVGYGLLVVATLAARWPWQNQTAAHRLWLAPALALTTPDTKVMDGKGETVFRRRAWYPVLETVTMERLRRGLLRDDMLEAIHTADVRVIHPDRIPEQDMARLAQSFSWLMPELLVRGRDLPAAQPGRVTLQPALPTDCYRLLRIEAGRYVSVGASIQLGDGAQAVDIPAPGDYRLLWCPAAERAMADNLQP